MKCLLRYSLSIEVGGNSILYGADRLKVFSKLWFWSGAYPIQFLVVFLVSFVVVALLHFLLLELVVFSSLPNCYVGLSYLPIFVFCPLVLFGLRAILMCVGLDLARFFECET